MTPIPKGPLSALICNYHPISITPVLAKFFVRLISLRFGRFLERSGALSSHQYSYRKSLGTCDALLDICIVCAFHLELDRGGAWHTKEWHTPPMAYIFSMPWMESKRLSRLISVLPLTGLIMGAFV